MVMLIGTFLFCFGYLVQPDGSLEPACQQYEEHVLVDETFALWYPYWLNQLPPYTQWLVMHYLKTIYYISFPDMCGGTNTKGTAWLSLGVKGCLYQRTLTHEMLHNLTQTISHPKEVFGLESGNLLSVLIDPTPWSGAQRLTIAFRR